MEKQVHRKRKLEWMNKEFQEIEQLNMLHEVGHFLMIIIKEECKEFHLE